MILFFLVTAGFLLFTRSSETASAQPLPECRVGLVMPTTGGMAPYGAEGVIAGRVAHEEATYNFRDCKPILLVQDSGSDPTQANSAAAVLVSKPNSVLALVGEINSADTAAMVSQARSAGVPILAPTASMISLTQMATNIFRIWPSDAYEASKMAEHMINEGINDVAVLYIEVPYGKEMATYFKNAFEQAGGRITVEGYPKDTFDFTPLLQRSKRHQAIYIISYIEDAALLLKKAYELRQKSQERSNGFRIYGTSVLDSMSLVEKAGLGAEGLTFAVVQPGADGDTAKRTAFLSAYKAAREKAQSEPALRSAAREPTFVAFHVYDAISITFAACESYVKKQQLSGASISDFLRNLTGFSGVTGQIAFDNKGDLATSRTVVFKHVKGGQINTLLK